jgi:hypothetical protein
MDDRRRFVVRFSGHRHSTVMKKLRPWMVTSVGLLVAAACGGTVNIGYREDSGTGDAMADNAAPGLDATPVFSDVAAPDAAADSPNFFVLLTETPPGPTEPISTWGGVLQFNVPDDFLDASPGLGIPNLTSNNLHDPDSLVFRKTTAELFIGNRHGNDIGDGTRGSISRFLYTAADQKFAPNGLITTGTSSGLFAVAQIYLDPTEEHLFAANYGAGTVSRFVFNPDPTFEGDIIKNVSPLGLVVAPSGKTLYLTEVYSGTIRRFDPITGKEILPSIPTPGSRPEWMTIASNLKTLFVCDIDGAIYVFDIGTNDDLTLVQTIKDDYPISVTLSPDETELFVAEHDFVNNTMKEVHRFKKTSSGWTLNGVIPVGSGLGGTLTFYTSSVPTPIK